MTQDNGFDTLAAEIKRLINSAIEVKLLNLTKQANADRQDLDRLTCQHKALATEFEKTIEQLGFNPNEEYQLHAAQIKDLQFQVKLLEKRVKECPQKSESVPLNRRFENAGLPWSVAEDAILHRRFKEFVSGQSFEHRRTPKAVECRIRHKIQEFNKAWL